MTNNSKQSQQTVGNLATALFANAQNLSEWNIKAIKESLNELQHAYLVSSMADNKQDRRNVVFHHSLLERFLDKMLEFNPEQFDELSNLKIQEHV